MAGTANGGVGAGVSPKTALTVGLKVDVDALPPATVTALTQGQVNLEDPATTLVLLKANAVVGVTGVFEMPNTDPLTINEATFTDKIKRGRHRMHCDFAFFIGGTRENVQDLPELERAPGCAGVKVFIGSSTGALLVEDDESLRRIFRVTRRRAAFHAEDEYRLNERKPLRIEGDTRSHPVWRDEPAALIASGSSSAPAMLGIAGLSPRRSTASAAATRCSIHQAVAIAAC